ncbi:MAG: cell cycle protein, partial [Ferruginibacter sp.]
MSIFMQWFSNRKLERSCLLVIAVIMGLLFWKLFSVLQRDFAEVNTRMENGTMINLNDNRNYENMTNLLQRGMYFEDPKDISFIASTVATSSDTTVIMANVGELNKKDLFVNADEAFLKGGRSFKKRVMLSRNLLGFSGPDSISFEKERSKPLAVNAETNAGLGDHTITGIIKNAAGQPVTGALVRLKALALQDSTTASEAEDQKSIIQFKEGVRKIFVPDTAKSKRLVSFNAYARTDVSGKFIFSGLPANRSYELLPLQPGYEFGRSLGVENLQANTNFSFVQSPHMMRLFSAKDFNSFKKEKAFIVRTPGEVSSWFWMIMMVFFSSFFLLHFILTIRFPAADQLLLPVIMILTGLSFITLFSLQDPLRDRFLAKSTFIYFCIGMAGILVLQFINVRKFTTDSPLFRLFIFKDGRKAANGWPWAVAAIGLLILTILFGTGPEGSGVKVNL